MVCRIEYIRWDGVESVCQLDHGHFGDHYWTSADGSQWTWWSKAA